MDDLQELYQETILDHNKNPRNFGKIVSANLQLEGYNPMCGDKYLIYLKVVDGVIEEISFEGEGCAISKSSASIMTTLVKGKNVKEAKDLFEKIHLLLTDKEIPDASTLGKLAVFSGVREYPARVKCASLAWHTMNSALNNEENSISTE